MCGILFSRHDVGIALSTTSSYNHLQETYTRLAPLMICQIVEAHGVSLLPRICKQLMVAGRRGSLAPAAPQEREGGGGDGGCNAHLYYMYDGTTPVLRRLHYRTIRELV